MTLRLLLPALLLLAAAPGTASQQLHKPLYIVNGVVCDDLQAIPPEEIEHVEELPADEQTIARYGPAASNGVILVTLRYDTPARFCTDAAGFDDYIAGQVRWDENEPTARVVLRYRILPDGGTEVTEELESTDNRLKRRILKAMAEAPPWTPATKDNRPIPSEGVLRIQLPAGREMPRPVELVLRGR